MPLASYGGVLLSAGGSLANQCCCSRYDCVLVGTDECGRPIYACQPLPNGKYLSSNCNGDCEPLGPCEPPCGPCEARSGDSCVSICQEGEHCVNGVCVPDCGTAGCGVCEECVNGVCVPKCGECSICVDGECVPCPEGYVCEDGVCVPEDDQYYCCYEYFDEPSPGSPGEGGGGSYSTSCQRGPCGELIDGVFVPQSWRNAGGPYGTLEECEDECRRHACVVSPCCGPACVPDADGEHDTKGKCLASCDGGSTDTPCVLSPANPTAVSGTGAGAWSYYFAIDPAPNRPVCVSYVNKCGRPIRVQIFAATLDEDGCTAIAERVIKVDSEWRGSPNCACGPLPQGQSFKGEAKGVVKWNTKQHCVTQFEVKVMTLCEESDWEIAVSCGDCPEVPGFECCRCCCTDDGILSARTKQACDDAGGTQIVSPITPRVATISVKWCGLEWTREISGVDGGFFYAAENVPHLVGGEPFTCPATPPEGWNGDWRVAELVKTMTVEFSVTYACNVPEQIYVSVQSIQTGVLQVRPPGANDYGYFAPSGVQFDTHIATLTCKDEQFSIVLDDNNTRSLLNSCGTFGLYTCKDPPEITITFEDNPLP